jgi:hypothetical protein
MSMSELALALIARTGRFNSAGSPGSYRWVVAAGFLFIAAVAWHGEAIPAQLQLTWQGSGGESGFAIERATGAGWEEIATTNTGVTTYTDSDVVDTITYCYRVRAFNPTAYSDYSNVACGTPPSVDYAAANGAGDVPTPP